MDNNNNTVSKMGCADLPVHITIYQNEKSPKPSRSTLTRWGNVVSILNRRDIRPGKSGGAFSMVRLAEGTSRANDNVEALFTYVIDSDSGVSPDEFKARLAGHEAVIYSSHSHTPEHPKFRVVMPLCEPVEPADWAAFHAAADERFAGGANDPATKDKARLYYLPSCPADRQEEAFFEHIIGMPIDPAPLIERGRELLAVGKSLAQQAAPAGNRTRALAINSDVLGVALPVDLERAKSALMAIPSDLPRLDWVKVVMAFNSATAGGCSEVLHRWCAQSGEKYHDWEKELGKARQSDKMDGSGVGAGTLFMTATAHGWIDPARPKTAAEPHPAERTAVMQTLNDAGNADRLVAASAGHLRYCRDFLSWLVWHDGHWHWDTKGGVVQFATSVMRGIYDEAKTETRNDDAKRLAQHASNSLSQTRIMAALELAKSCAGIAVSASELDADPWLVGVLNGVIELRTGRFRAARPDDLITRRMNVEYDAGATCPTWAATLDAVFCDSRNVVDFFQRAAGYSMTGITSEQCFFFLYGSGANGKSTILNVMREILGGYGMQTSPDVLMAKTAANASGPTPEIARLAGPRFVAANETEEGQRFAESMVKQLTGGDAVTARVLQGAPFDFVPVFKLWLAGNHRPVIRGDDHGIWRRMVMIGFDRKFSGPEQNKHLPELLRKEYSGVLNWLIAGCTAWQKHGLDRPPEIVRQVDAYRSDMDLMQHWLDEMCCVGADGQVRAGAAYTAYKNWSVQNGHRSISNIKFAQKLKDRGFDKGNDKTGAYYIGLTFRQGQF